MCPNLLYGSRISPRHAGLLGAVPAELSSYLGRSGWTSSWTHQADSGCSSPGIIPENYLLELADHHPQRGRRLHGVKRCAAASEPSHAHPHCTCALLTPPLTSLFRAFSGASGGRLDTFGGRPSFWPASADAVQPAAPPPPPPRLRTLVFECVDWPSGQLPTVPGPCIGGLRGW